MRRNRVAEYDDVISGAMHGVKAHVGSFQPASDCFFYIFCLSVAGIFFMCGAIFYCRSIPVPGGTAYVFYGFIEGVAE